MEINSYVDSVRPHLSERSEKVNTIVNMLRRIVRNHAIFDDASVGNPMTTPLAAWNQEKTDEAVYFNLDGDDGVIYEADIVGKDKGYEVVRAELQFLDDDTDITTVMTIEIEPPNVMGYDGAPLTSPQLDGAINDMQRYEDALAKR